MPDDDEPELPHRHVIDLEDVFARLGVFAKLKVSGEPGEERFEFVRPRGDIQPKPPPKPEPIEGTWGGNISVDLESATVLAEALGRLAESESGSRAEVRITGRFLLQVVEKDGQRFLSISPQFRLRGENERRPRKKKP